ncbi:MAG: hypothetical protein IBX56_20015 [Methylomicrobium sp.]|nr:hypothetical protein [Methylomicrobium sp.]
MTKLSFPKAIRAKCEDCIYDPLAGGTCLQQIEKCTAKDCALHSLRPLTSATKKRLFEESLTVMTPEEREKALAEKKKRAELARERFSTSSAKAK